MAPTKPRLSSPKKPKTTKALHNDLLGHALGEASPQSSRTTKKTLLHNKRKAIDMSSLPSLQKVAHSKNTKRKKAKPPPPPADAASPVTEIERRHLGKSREKVMHITPGNDQEAAKQIAQELIKECIPIKDEALRLRRRGELKRVWKRKHLNLNSEEFNSLWNEARILLNQAIIDDQEREQDIQEVVEISRPPAIPNNGTKKAPNKEPNKSGKAPSKRRARGRKTSSKPIANADKQGTNSNHPTELDQPDSEPHAKSKDDSQPEIPEVTVVDEFEGAGANRWSDLVPGLQFEGEKFLFGDWDSTNTYL
jgi:hypothetical protein